MAGQRTTKTSKTVQKPRMALHLVCPMGAWRVICGRRQFNLRDGARVNFTHRQELRK